jgi:hypothetical protein
MSAPIRLTVPIDADGSRMEVDAYPTPTPGLFIHGSVDDSSTWTIAHQASGLILARFADPEAALACAIDLGSITDWARAVDEPAIRDRARAVLIRWGALRRSRSAPRRVARALGAIQ